MYICIFICMNMYIKVYMHIYILGLNSTVVLSLTTVSRLPLLPLTYNPLCVCESDGGGGGVLGGGAGHRLRTELPPTGHRQRHRVGLFSSVLFYTLLYLEIQSQSPHVHWKPVDPSSASNRSNATQYAVLCIILCVSCNVCVAGTLWGVRTWPSRRA